MERNWICKRYKRCWSYRTFSFKLLDFRGEGHCSCMELGNGRFHEDFVVDELDQFAYECYFLRVSTLDIASGARLASSLEPQKL